MAHDTVADLDTKTVANARRQYVELYGSALVLNSYFKLVIVLLVVGNLAQTGALYWVFERQRNVQPLVIQVDENGRAEAGQFRSNEFTPSAATIRHFLTRFTELHFSRNRSRIASEHAQSLHFLAAGVPNETCAEDPAGPREVEAFIANPTAGDVDVHVSNTILRRFDQPPYSAEVRFTCVFKAYGSSRSTSTKNLVMQVDFDRLLEIPEAFVKVNPLGFRIHRLHVDKAFEEDPQ